MLNPLVHLRAIILALSQIWANKTRSFLTTLGIIIGVIAVTFVIAVLTGMKTKILTEFETFGASKMFIFPDRPEDAPRNKYPWREIRLKVPELEALGENCPSIRQLTPMTNEGAVIQFRDRIREGVTVTGIWPDWHDIENRSVIMGREFSVSDEEGAHQVCLVNDEAIKELDLDADPTGQHILVNGRRFKIVGVVETLQASMFGPQTTSSEVFIPFSTMIRRKDPEFFFYIIAKVVSPEAAEEAKAEATFVLRTMRGLDATEPDTFEVAAIDQFIDQFKAIAAVITVIAGGIVAISLLVGGIGIMNIMLVSVSERTREIGLRKAVGARPSVILMQFLLEAVTLSLLGGLIGLVCSEGLLTLISVASDKVDRMPTPVWAIGLAFGFCAGVGVVFGMFPAIKASRLDPIDALRHE